jgi:hypothetical protein
MRYHVLFAAGDRPEPHFYSNFEADDDDQARRVRVPWRAARSDHCSVRPGLSSARQSAARSDSWAAPPPGVTWPRTQPCRVLNRCSSSGIETRRRYVEFVGRRYGLE